ncbi:MAG: hypothetical protein ACYTEQ_09590 [Planctomycetota bacterium]
MSAPIGRVDDAQNATLESLKGAERTQGAEVFDELGDSMEGDMGVKGS